MSFKPPFTLSFESITPDKAQAILETKNNFNRRMNLGNASSLCLEMNAGTFITTHQGIAFATDGELIDGQTRLQAIVDHGHPMWLAVYRYASRKHITRSGKEIDVMFAIDGGAKRTTGQTMGLKDGSITNPNLVAAMCNVIMRQFAGTIHSKTSATQIEAVYDVYKKNVDTILSRGFPAHMKHATFFGMLAMLNAGYPTQEEALSQSLISMAGLTQGSPVRALDDFVKTKLRKMCGGKMRTEAMMIIAYACMKFVDGEPAKKLYPSQTAVDRIVASQAAKVKKVKLALGLAT